MHSSTFVTAILLALLSVSNLPAEDGLVAHWRFDSASNTVADLSGKGHTGQIADPKIVVEEGKNLLVLDDQEGMTVPSSKELNLQQGFTIALRIKPGRFSHGRLLADKENQFSLRITEPKDGSNVVFFPYVAGSYEPRVSSSPLLPDVWYNIVATWDGQQAMLWINGRPYAWNRAGQPPAPNDAPVRIAAAPPHWGDGGRLEYAKIYQRVLSPSEIICEAFGISPDTTASSAVTCFDFRNQPDPGVWHGLGGATASITDQQLQVLTTTSDSIVVNDRINAPVEKEAFISLKMTVDQGTQARLVYVTTQGAEVVPFQTYADQKSHTYVIETKSHDRWGGQLLALGLIPSEIEGTTARIEQIGVARELHAAPEIHISHIFSDSTLPRTERPERIIARIVNSGGAADGLTITLTAPEGIAIQSPAAQSIASFQHGESKDVAWEVMAQKPGEAAFQVNVATAKDSNPATATQTINIQPNMHLAKADYVPVPIPAKTQYTLWTHYCPLWKVGTHEGWQKIEPWPERKPVLGWYNEGSPEVADWHIKYMLEHGISGSIYCWYRANNNGPVDQKLGHALHDGLLKARYLPMFKFGIMWENAFSGVSSTEDLLQNLLPFWIENYFSNPSYIRIDGKPVLYVYVPGNLTAQLGGSDKVRAALDQMRSECQRRGLGGLYLIGCIDHEARKDSLIAMKAEGWDATSSYVNGWLPPAKVATVGDFVCSPIDSYLNQQEATWKFKRQMHLLPDIPALTMGWDSRPWRETEFFWSENSPEKFHELCLRAKAMMESPEAMDIEKKTAIFCCWNEFGEGHYIEPTRGYGFSYLDVIREVFCENSQDHADIAPEDVGRIPEDSWYREFKQQPKK